MDEENKENQKSIISHSFEIAKQELLEFSNYIDYVQMKNVTKIIRKSSGKIIFTGCGTSAMAAKKAVHTLSCIGIDAVFLVPSDAVHGSLGIVNQKDIVIMISKGGNTSEIVRLLPSLEKKNTYLIGVTENEKSKIAINSDVSINLKTKNELDYFNMLATTSILKVILYFDIVAALLMEDKKYTEEEFYVNHPKGAVGKKLELKIG